MADVPTGNVTFLFTDLEGSTRYWEEFPELMPAVYDRHDAILRQVITDHSGIIYKVVGDAIQAAFFSPEKGVAAAVAAQQQLLIEEWPIDPAPRVRMALHFAEVSPDASGDFRSPRLNRLGRLLSAAEGGQILLSADLAAALGSAVGLPISLLDLGEQRFRDLTPQRVYQALATGIPSERARLLALSAHRHNLMPPSTSLVGRDSVIVELTALLRLETTRLVTLLGPGGVGKTRMAQAVASDLLDEFSDGVWFVPLESLDDPEDLTREIARTLGIREIAEQSSLDAVIGHFEKRNALLVLDNFEQIVEASPIVTTLIRRCPGLTILATSRMPLELAAEVEFQVSPLDIDQSAADLFVERYRAVQPSFILTPESRSSVVEICRRLDGLPLAIELAAARGRLLTVDKLAARLKERLPLLVGGPRDAPTRQQTLQSTIAWSVDLLGPFERACFSGMAIFWGGASVDAIEPILGAVATPGPEYFDVLTCVENLVRHNLVKVEPSGRLTMLETIREYATGLLRDSVEFVAVEAAHAQYFLELVLASQSHLIDAEQTATLQSLTEDWSNIRQALSCFEAQGPVTTFAEMATALWRFWSARGMYSEGRRWLDSAINQARETNVDGPLLAAVLDGAGILAESQGDADAAQALHLEALSLWRESGDSTGIARSLENLGILALHSRGDLALARELHTEALHHFEQSRDRRGIASSLKSLADVALFSEDFAEASSLYVRSLTIARQLHDSRGIAAGLTSLGALAFLAGDSEQAIARYEEAIELWRLLDDVPGVALCVGNLGEALASIGRGDEASVLLTECLDLSREIGDQQGIGFALTHLGRLARGHDARIAASHYAEAAELSQSIGDSARLAEAVEGLAGTLLDAGHAEMAARLFGMAHGIRQQTGIKLMSVHEQALGIDLDAATRALSPGTFAALFAEGEASDLDALLPTGGLALLSGRSS